MLGWANFILGIIIGVMFSDKFMRLYEMILNYGN